MFVHIFNNTNHKFSEPFFDFIERNFDIDKHIFLIIGDYSISNYRKRKNLVMIKNLKKEYIKFLKILKSANKIFLHQLFFSSKNLLFLSFQKKILKKTYWIIWGGDLYNYIQNKEAPKIKMRDFIRKKVIKNFGGIITFIKGDYDIAKKWYGTKAKYYYAFYPNPIDYKYLDTLSSNNKDKNGVIIQIGNSADPSNKHIEIFKKLEKFRNKNIKIICPLSYGNIEYAKTVIQEGNKIFGEKFKPLTEFLNANEYGKILSSIDVAIFNHDRQQALGNILALLYLGKKVYIKNTVTPWETFKKKRIKVFNTYDLDKESFESLLFMNDEDRKNNKKIIKEEFSEEKCKYYWKKIFEG